MRSTDEFMAANGLHISLAAEPIFYIGDFVITNSMFTSLIVSTILVVFAFTANKSLKQTNKPSGIQNFAEWVVESLYNLTYSVTNDMRKAALFLPLVSTFFLFILLNNWLGLLPGVGTIVTKGAEPTAVEQTEDHSTVSETLHTQEVSEASSEHEAASTEPHTEEEHHSPVPFLRPGTADLNTTIALGLVAMIAVQLFGYHHLKLAYFKKFFNFSSPIMFYVGLLELISELSKIISFAFRLFGNIFAGEVLLVVIGSLVGLIGPVPFYGLEVFVGFIQALVFSMLSLVLMNMATQSHDEH